jgi:hypothetical protein
MKPNLRHTLPRFVRVQVGDKAPGRLRCRPQSRSTATGYTMSGARGPATVHTTRTCLRLQRVGPVDNARIRISGLHRRQRRAHIVCTHHFVTHLIPETRGLEELARIDASRNTRDLPERQPADARGSEVLGPANDRLRARRARSPPSVLPRRSTTGASSTRSAPDTSFIFASSAEIKRSAGTPSLICRASALDDPKLKRAESGLVRA